MQSLGRKYRFSGEEKRGRVVSLSIPAALLALAGWAPALPAQVVINEIMQNPSAVADSNGEWFELFNPGATAVDIEGWTIQDNDLDHHVIFHGGPLLVPAGGFLVLGNNSDPSTNGGVAVDYVFSGLFLANGADELVLLDLFLTEIDRVEWDDGVTFPDPNGASMALADPALDNNSGGNWCVASTPFGDGDLGTPGFANDCVPGVGVRLSEVRIDQPGTDVDEYFELAGPAGTSLSGLSYLVIGDGAGGSGVVEAVVDLSGQMVPASGFFVAAESTFSLGSADLTTNLNFENSDNVTHLLVQGFTGSDGDDLDTDDDGTLDFQPWTQLVECVGLVETVGSGDQIYCATTVGPDGVFVPGHAYSCPASWEIGQFDPASGQDTPGAANACVVGSGTLVINEIDYDQPGTDTAEFIEIKNMSSGDIDLGSYSLELVNGSTAAIYKTIGLPSVLLPPGGYFVVCGDSSNLLACDLDVTPDSNLIQNGAPDAVALTLGGAIVDTVSYEGDTAAPYTEGTGSGLADSSSVPYMGISRYPDGTDSNQNNIDFSARCVTPGSENISATSNCAPPSPVEIFEIQGSGTVSPFANLVVTTLDNVVTAVAPNGFFMQTPELRADGDPDTSDGIFVFTGGPPAVSVGDLVDVSGQVIEFFELTEFSNGPTVTIAGVGSLPTPVTFDSTVPSPDPSMPSCAVEFECYEGMLIEIAGGTVSGPNQRFGSDPVAEVFITAAPSRAFREKGIEFPGIAGLPVWDGNPEVFELDPDKLGLPNAILPAGSTFDSVGVLGFEFGGYELWPTQLTVLQEPPLPDPVRARGSGEFTVASLNLFRFFDDVDDPPSINPQGEVRDDTVVSAAEYLLRMGKLAAYITEVLDSPDILAVQEAEKLEVLEDLATEIRSLDPSVDYSAFLIEGNDVGTIDVGFLVRDTVAVDAVTQLGASETFVNPVTSTDDLLHDRPPLLMEGRYVKNGANFALKVLGLHNRSLGGIDDPVDGARVRQKRLEQAQSIAQMVQDLQTWDPNARVVVAGDFNAFEFTDGYVDVVGQIRGDIDPVENLLSGPDLVDPDLTDQVTSLPPDERYSFIFRGSGQTLDHALTSHSLNPLVQGFELGRGNADSAVDLINNGGSVLRSSDHDGLVLYVLSDDDRDGVIDELDVCSDTVIPESVPTNRLGTNRWALTDGDGVFDTELAKGLGPRSGFTIHDTAGCSCEQIIDALHLGEGHEFFGCSTGIMREWLRIVNP